MVTLQETTAKFNNNLHVSHTGGRLSSDSGLVLVDELMDAFQFVQHSNNIVTYNEGRKYWTHTNDKILKQLVLQIIAGYDTDSAANILQADPVLQTLASDEPLASQSSISRFFDRITEETISSLQVFNQSLIDKARLVRNDTNMIIDLVLTSSRNRHFLPISFPQILPDKIRHFLSNQKLFVDVSFDNSRRPFEPILLGGEGGRGLLLRPLHRLRVHPTDPGSYLKSV